MNENMAGSGGLPVCEDEPGIQRAGCDGLAGSYYFTRQAISQFIQVGVASTLMERIYKSGDDLIVEEKPQRKYIVRRLTPIECARLQGFPDWWCDGADGSDSAQYRLWGNGIALPCAVDVIGRIAKELRRGRK
jgi:DNA (cytosine-5)-methyltransferase 1